MKEVNNPNPRKLYEAPYVRKRAVLLEGNLCNASVFEDKEKDAAYATKQEYHEETFDVKASDWQ